MHTNSTQDENSQTVARRVDRSRYARSVEISKRVRWEIERDVFRGREFDFSTTFLPEGLTKVAELPFLSSDDRRLLSQVQGRTYANMFGLVERFITAKVLQLSCEQRLGDQVVLEALVRFSDEELKHQEMFRRIEQMIGQRMPTGYRFVPQPDEVAGLVLGKSTWAVLALTCQIELFSQAHYRESIEPNLSLSPLFKDVFLYHWKEESQHAILDELEWLREDAKLTDAARDVAVDDLIALVGAVDGLLQLQSAEDVRYFLAICQRKLDSEQTERLRVSVLGAYRYQYILSGASHPRFVQLLGSLIRTQQGQRISSALAPLMP